MNPTTILCADFDGTMFDPSIRILLSPVYNNHTSRLIRKNNILYVVNTGRPVWDRFAHLQNMAIGMHKPDAVIAGAGTKIMWKKKVGYETDREWERMMAATKWDKDRIRKSIVESSDTTHLELFDTANPYMARAWVYRKSVAELMKLKTALEKKHPDTKILLTEQILLPNSTEFFSGYVLFIPNSAGKEQAARYVSEHFENKFNKPLKKIYTGDALVDVAMLLFDSAEGSASYGLNLTPLAREAVSGTHVHIRDGSPPAQLLKILKETVKAIAKPQNSPYRKLVSPLEAVVNLVYPSFTPDQISFKGLHLTQKGLQNIYGPQSSAMQKAGGYFGVLGGSLMDIVDGVRAKRNPLLKTADGQLIDGYADRNKEFIQLCMRAETRTGDEKKKTYEAAVSCFLPSIARARAECVGATVTEYDSGGGSALSRNKNLLVSLLYSAAALNRASYKADMKIYDKNLKTYEARIRFSPQFSWSKLGSYDLQSAERLQLYTEMFQQAVKETHTQDWVRENKLEEYTKIAIKPSILKRIHLLSSPTHAPE